jgi:O-methyltransferase involved in polyketide biosynthesis
MIFVHVLRLSWLRDWIIDLSEKSNPGIWSGILCRNCYIDEKLVASRKQIEAVVNLGAGFDTRLHRLPELSGLPPREVDQRELAAQGYSGTKPTFFVCEAVTQYLTEQGVRTTFGWLANAAKGSRLAFTYVRKGFLAGRNAYGWQNGYRRFVATKVWLFGMEPKHCPSFVRCYGWRIIEDVGYDELADRYLVTAGRRLSFTPVERIVYAEKV